VDKRIDDGVNSESGMHKSSLPEIPRAKYGGHSPIYDNRMARN
jgi:hypothetical protein